ncbi:glucosaminidase domain-containing protein [Enterococcus innesii]|uniref:glucosaminidase domain-containing protein n=1 Tax=Enterococcus innesii TaxID=2839759 RepID=UPI002DBFF986|nr:glucosaminidase domain-containing protein [Enterococcus innesii]MEB5949963.1 glucosaminidase domain-containing protein [Enterococcus innesii]
MKSYQTRSERHHQPKKSSKKPSKKAVASLMSAGMMLAPTAISFVPQQVQATENQYATQNISGFIEQIGWSAQDVAANNDLYASVMIAQAILESGYGSSALSNTPYYNLFGVKGSYNGQSVYMPTQEYLNGQWVEMNEPFRQYNSYWESFQDHANVLRSTSFATGTAHYTGVWKSQTTSFYDATNYLTGRYATDPGYAQKLNWLIETYQLTRFDTGTTQSTAWSNTTSTTTSETTTTTYSGSTSSAQSYQVASGDTLWDIANRFGTTVDALMASNGLSSETIVIGQELIV